MRPGQRFCRLCERPAAEGGLRAAELDAAKFQEWSLNFLGATLASDLHRDDFICCFCVWDAQFLLQSEDSIGHFEELRWWPKEAGSGESLLFDAYRDGEVKQCWVPLKKLKKPQLDEAEGAENEAEESIRKAKCVYCDKCYARTNDLAKHIEKIHSKIALRCSFRSSVGNCTKHFLTVEDRNVHLKEHFKVKKTSLICIYCKKSYAAKNDLLKHSRRMHANIYIKCQVKICGKYFHTKADLHSHFKEVHGAVENEKKFECQICDYKAIKKYQMNRHIKYCHQRAFQAIKCSKCSTTFDNNEKLKNHIRKFHTFKNCPQCDQRISKGLFKNHLGKKVCKKCRKSGNSFECLGLLRKHKEDCEAQKYSCEFCSKEFPVKCLLKYHINRHHLSKNKRGIDQVGLKFANDSQIGFKFKCSHCSKKFRKKSHLQEHLSHIHNLIEKRFQCAECDKNFYSRSKLKQHSTYVHSKVKVQCSICQSKIKTNHLKKHMVHMHGLSEIKFFCNS